MHLPGEQMIAKFQLSGLFEAQMFQLRKELQPQLQQILILSLGLQMKS